jgi:hypothetical protein
MVRITTRVSTERGSAGLMLRITTRVSTERGSAGSMVRITTPVSTERGSAGSMCCAWRLVVSVPGAVAPGPASAK